MRWQIFTRSLLARVQARMRFGLIVGLGFFWDVSILEAQGPEVGQVPNESETEDPQPKLLTRLLSLGDADPEEVREALGAVLTSRGRLVLLSGSRKVLLVDEPGAVDAAEALLRELGRPRPNVRVEVRMNTVGGQSDAGVDVRYRVGGRDVQVGNALGTRNRLDIDVRDQRTTRTQNNTQFLVTRSGHAASIRVVRKVPVPEVLIGWLLDRGYVQMGVRYEDVGSQMAIRPIVRGNSIEVEVVPQVTALVEGRPLTIEVKELITRVTVANGGELQIGGFQGADETFNRSFFGGGGRSRASEVTSIHLRASVVGGEL